jgi:hypothetical protein
MPKPIGRLLVKPQVSVLDFPSTAMCFRRTASTRRGTAAVTFARHESSGAMFCRKCSTI